MHIILAAAKSLLLVFIAVTAFMALYSGIAAKAQVMNQPAQCIAAKQPICLFMIY